MLFYQNNEKNRQQPEDFAPQYKHISKKPKVVKIWWFYLVTNILVD
jgi:hypothetical protein